MYDCNADGAVKGGVSEGKREAVSPDSHKASGSADLEKALTPVARKLERVTAFVLAKVLAVAATHVHEGCVLRWQRGEKVEDSRPRLVPSLAEVTGDRFVN